MKMLLFIAAFILLANTAHAARGFGSTFGTGTTDIIATGYSTALATNYSMSFWMNLNGSGGGGLGRMYDQANNTAGDFLSETITASVVQISEAWTLSTGGQATWTFTAAADNVWQHICMTRDASSTSNNPIVYVNGVSTSVANVMAPLGSFNPGAFTLYIGNRNNLARIFDGKIAEFALYNGSILTAQQCESLASGYSPLQVRQSALTLYLPLYGQLPNEQDWGPSHYTQTIAGTKFQPHPPIQPYPNIRYGQ